MKSSAMSRKLSPVRRFLLLLIMTVLASCAPIRPQLGPPVSQPFAEGLVQDWLANSGAIRTVQGLASVRVKAPLNNVNGTQVVLAEKPDRLRTETLSPFGAPLFLLMSDGQRLGVSLPAQNLYYIASATPENLGQFINIPLEVPDLVSTLLYNPPLLEAWKVDAYERVDGGWLLFRRGTLRHQELVFNALRQLVSVSFYEENELVVRVEYQEFVPRANGGYFPQRLNLELPEKYATISLEFSDVEINGSLRPGLFKVVPPPGARVVYLPD